MSRLDRINDWLERASLAHYRAASLAKNCSVSQSQLQRFFAVTLRDSPQHWLNEVRVWEAAYLLLASELSVKEIAGKLHFANESHLCHRFKEYFGCSPSQFVHLPAARLFGPEQAFPQARLRVMKTFPDRPRLGRALIEWKELLRLAFSELYLARQGNLNCHDAKG